MSLFRVSSGQGRDVLLGVLDSAGYVGWGLCWDWRALAVPCTAWGQPAWPGMKGGTARDPVWLGIGCVYVGRGVGVSELPRAPPFSKGCETHPN